MLYLSATKELLIFPDNINGRFEIIFLNIGLFIILYNDSPSIFFLWLIKSILSGFIWKETITSLKISRNSMVFKLLFLTKLNLDEILFPST